MYDTLWQMITNDNYTLSDITNKINVFWAEGLLSDEERAELKELALNNINVDQEKPELETTVESLAARIAALEIAVAELQDETSETSEASAGYDEWVTWDGISNNYQYGAIVSHNGTLWISVYNGQNVWEPGVVGTEALWQEYTE